MSPQQVADYLTSHPDFLEINNYLLTELSIRHQSGQSVSLIERQVSALRQENQLTLLDETVTVHLPGGSLSIVWAGEGQTVKMTGPCKKVFEGRIYP